MMAVTDRLDGKFASLANLGKEAIYELAAPKTPDEVREEVERLIAAGEVVTAVTVRDLRMTLAATAGAFARADAPSRRGHGGPPRQASRWRSMLRDPGGH